MRMNSNETSRAIWMDTPLSDLASESARMAGVGDPNDAGWTWTLPSQYPDLIPLGGGIPDAPTIPTEQFREALNAVLDEEADEAMVYGGWTGFDGLREAMAERQNRIEGLGLDADNFIIHNGSSAAMDNIAKGFINQGDVVIVEGPSFSGIVETIQAYLAEVVEVPVDDDGVSLEAVASAIAEAESSGKTVKMLYTIADYHNPTGVTMSASRRAALLELCARHRVLLVEDGAYSELYFDSPPPPSMYALSDGYGVMRVGSFSKVAATGLRIGWVQARHEIVSALSKVRYDMGTSPILLRAMARYIKSGHLETHVAEMRELYALKCRNLCDSLEEHCSEYVRFTRPQGGFFLWLECVGASAAEVREAAAEEGLIFPSGSTFFHDPDKAGDRYLRLAFSAASVEQMRQVGPRLASAFRKVVG
jgi:2-aminoadipate transaminase